MKNQICVPTKERGNEKNKEDSNRFTGKGFSLVELLVVMAILSVMLALVAPMVFNSWEKLRFQATVRNLVSGLRYARYQAIATKMQVNFQLDQEEQRYQISFRMPAETAEGDDSWKDFEEGLRRRERTVLLPQGVRLKGLWRPGQDSSSEGGVIVFYPQGNSSGGKIALESSKGRELWVVVDPWGGRIKVTAPM